MQCVVVSFEFISQCCGLKGGEVFESLFETGLIRRISKRSEQKGWQHKVPVDLVKRELPRSLGGVDNLLLSNRSTGADVFQESLSTEETRAWRTPPLRITHSLPNQQWSQLSCTALVQIQPTALMGLTPKFKEPFIQQQYKEQKVTFLCNIM